MIVKDERHEKGNAVRHQLHADLPHGSPDVGRSFADEDGREATPGSRKADLLTDQAQDQYHTMEVCCVSATLLKKIPYASNITCIFLAYNYPPPPRWVAKNQ